MPTLWIMGEYCDWQPCKDCLNGIREVVGNSLKRSRDIITKRKQKGLWAAKTTDTHCATFQLVGEMNCNKKDETAGTHC